MSYKHNDDLESILDKLIEKYGMEEIIPTLSAIAYNESYNTNEDDHYREGMFELYKGLEKAMDMYGGE